MKKSVLLLAAALLLASCGGGEATSSPAVSTEGEGTSTPTATSQTTSTPTTSSTPAAESTTSSPEEDDPNVRTLTGTFTEDWALDAGAVFYAYGWGTGLSSTWYAGEVVEGKLVVKLDLAVTAFLVARFDPNGTLPVVGTSDWVSCWNQTLDITITEGMTTFDVTFDPTYVEDETVAITVTLDPSSLINDYASFYIWSWGGTGVTSRYVATTKDGGVLKANIGTDITGFLVQGYSEGSSTPKAGGISWVDGQWKSADVTVVAGTIDYTTTTAPAA